VAPPRHRRKRRPSRTVGGPAPVVEPEPEPLPPPRRGLMASLMGPPRPMGPPSSVVPGPATQTNLGPPWNRRDWYVLSGIAALVVVVVGLIVGVTDTTSSTVQSKPAPTSTSFAVASGDGKTFLCGSGINLDVAGNPAHVAGVDGDQITLTAPLGSAPASGAAVSQSMLVPGTVAVCAAVASSPAPTATQFTLAGGAGVDFVDAAVTVDGQPATIKSIDSSSYRITLSQALAAPPTSGAPVVQQLYTTGSLIGGIVGLAISEISILILAVAAWLARPFATRIVKKARPKILETFVFGALVAVVDTLVYYLEVSTLGSTTGAGVAVAELTAAASGFVLVPLVYPTVSRMFRRTPRPAPASRSGR